MSDEYYEILKSENKGPTQRMNVVNIFVLANCETREDVEHLEWTLESISVLKGAINFSLIGYLNPQIEKQMIDLGVVIETYPKINFMEYLRLCMKTKNLDDKEWIILVKSGDLLLKNGMDELKDEQDGYIGVHYLGMDKNRDIFPEAEGQQVTSIYNFIEQHQEHMICSQGLSGSAIRAEYLRIFFEFNEPKEYRLLQFIESLDRVGFLTSPIVYRQPFEQLDFSVIEPEPEPEPELDTKLLIKKLDEITELNRKLKKIKDIPGRKAIYENLRKTLNEICGIIMD